MYSMELLIWGVLPYMAIAIMCMGILWKTPCVKNQQISVIDKFLLALFLFIVGGFIGISSGVISNTLNSSLIFWLKSLLFLDPIVLSSEHWFIQVHYLILCATLILLPFSNVKLIVKASKQYLKNKIYSSSKSKPNFKEEEASFFIEKSVS